MFALLDLLGGQWADSNNEGMFGGNSVASNGDTGSGGNFFHGSYLNGHTNLGSMSWRATNWCTQSTSGAIMMRGEGERGAESIDT